MTDRIDDTSRILAVPNSADAAIRFWHQWFSKWRRRIQVFETSAILPRRRGQRARAIRAIDIFIAWKRLYWPAVETHYVMPDSWLHLTDDEKRRPDLRPQPIPIQRRVRSAQSAGPGFSIDDAGPFLKLPDGTIFRDRASASDRFWRSGSDEGVSQLADWLPSRPGQAGTGHPVRGREADRVLHASVSYGLVAAGMTRVAAARQVLAWREPPDLDINPMRFAAHSTRIWRELLLPL